MNNQEHVNTRVRLSNIRQLARSNGAHANDGNVQNAALNGEHNVLNNQEHVNARVRLTHIRQLARLNGARVNDENVLNAARNGEHI